MYPRPIQSIGRMLGFIVGLLLGMRFGILGLLIGFFLGNKLDEALGQIKPTNRVNRRTVWTQQIIIPAFQLMGYLAKYDGTVSSKSIDAVTRCMQRFRLNKTQKNTAKSAFNTGKSEQFNPHGPLQKLQMLLLMYPSLRNSIARAFVEVAESDQPVSIRKLNQLDHLLRGIGILRAQNAHQRNQNPSTEQPTNHNLHWARQVLGVSGATSIEQIKRTYRKLLSDHHPDRLQTRGVSPTEAAVKRANEKTHEIKKAYTLLKTHHEQQRA